MNESLLWNLTGKKTSNIINNSNLPLESFIFLPVPRGGWCGLCTANSCQTQHCLLLKICLLRICCLHVFLELLHEYFLQKQFIHKVFQIIRKSVTSSFKTWPAWSGACSHSTLCCRETAGETELAPHFWLGQSHLGYWTHKALNITSKRKHFFRDLLWKANARLLSLRLCKGNLPGPCQNSLKEHSGFGPMKHLPAVLPSCPLLGVPIWRQLHWYNVMVMMDFHACLGQGEGPKRTKTKSWFIECVLHLLLLRYEPGPPCSAPQQMVETWRHCSCDPLTFFLWSFLS